MTKTKKDLPAKDVYAYRFAIDAINDYVSSRILFINGPTLNSLQLASTAIEKLLKSFINFYDSEIRTEYIHKSSVLYKNYEHIFKTHDISLDVNFLQWLSDVYISRYTSEWHRSKEVMFGEKHFLASLDEIFYQIFSQYNSSLSQLADMFFKNKYINQIKRDNYCMLGIDREKFVTLNAKVFCYHIFNGFDREINLDLVTFNPKNPFLIRDAIVENDNIIINLDVGMINLGKIPNDILVYNRDPMAVPITQFM